jgi:ribosomal protein S18 acetylase RimI-like enzyme
VDVRLLGPGDAALAEQACRLYAATGDVDPAVFLGRQETALVIAEDDDRVVGCAYGHELVHPDGERTMLLYSLDVAEASRRRGVGRRLVNAFVDHARERGCTEVWVLTDDDNPAGVATYRSAGGRRASADPTMFAWHLAEGRHS